MHINENPSSLSVWKVEKQTEKRYKKDGNSKKEVEGEKEGKEKIKWDEMRWEESVIPYPLVTVTLSSNT